MEVDLDKVLEVAVLRKMISSLDIYNSGKDGIARVLNNIQILGMIIMSKWNILIPTRERERELRSFENSYIFENPRTPPISYISQTVITFKKPTLGSSKTFIIIIIR
ncbi:hypothetical protein LXL04_014881 [Taraxacum kok-saghyz]